MPQDPTIHTFASGRYYGASTLASATGCGCVSEIAQDWLSSDSEDPWIYRQDPINTFEWEIQQLDADIRGTILFFNWNKGLSGPASCEVEGSKPNFLEDEGLFSASTLSCEGATMHVECANGRARELELEGLHWQGTLHRNDYGSDGEWSGTWSCRDSQTGNPVGSLTLRGEWAMLHDCNPYWRVIG
jgi:hypothetical protein